MEGGFFLAQHVDFTEAEGIVIITYDEDGESLRPHDFGNGAGILEYTYEVNDDTSAVSIDIPRAKGKCVGRFAEDGDSFTGRWIWTQVEVEMGYDATMIRVGSNDPDPDAQRVCTGPGGLQGTTCTVVYETSTERNWHEPNL